MKTLKLFIVVTLLLTGWGVALANTESISREAAFSLLTEKSFKKKRKAILALSEQGGDTVILILKTMLAGDLYFIKEDQSLVTVKKLTNSYTTTDVLTGTVKDNLQKKAISKVKINNKIRQILRQSIALLEISNPDKKKRLTALAQFLKEPGGAPVQQIEQLHPAEKDPDVREMMKLVMNLYQLEAEPENNIEIISSFDRRLEPEVRNLLMTLAGHQNQEVAAEAQRSLEKIDARISLLKYVETIFFGISLGSILVLAAIGLSITFGVMGVINMAHGELIMLGAYATYVMQQLLPNHICAALILSVPVAFLVAALTGVLIERTIIRHLYGRSLETLLATFGVSLILQQAVRTVFSPLNRTVESPDWLTGALTINPVLSLTYNRIAIVAFCFAVFLILLYVMKKTNLGLHVRAVAQNRRIARAMGVKSERVDMITFGLGSGIAGVAGVALSQLGNVGPNLGQSYIIDSFMVVVFGGVGNLWGTMVSGLTLGIANKFLEPITGAVLAKILVLVAIILFIQKRPRGLFPQKGRALES